MSFSFSYSNSLSGGKSKMESIWTRCLGEERGERRERREEAREGERGNERGEGVRKREWRARQKE
jgi:hypothetical protein